MFSTGETDPSKVYFRFWIWTYKDSKLSSDQVTWACDYANLKHWLKSGTISVQDSGQSPVQ